MKRLKNKIMEDKANFMMQRFFEVEKRSKYSTKQPSTSTVSTPAERLKIFKVKNNLK